MMPRKASSVFERLSLPGGAPSRSLGVPKKLDDSSSPAKAAEDGSVSMIESKSTKLDLYSKRTRNEPIYTARRARISPVLRHETDARVEPLSSYPREKTRRSKPYEFKPSIKDRGSRDHRNNSSKGMKRQLAPRVLFSCDVDVRTKAIRVSSRCYQSKNGSINEINSEKSCVKVTPLRESPPKETSSVLARYGASSGWYLW